MRWLRGVLMVFVVGCHEPTSACADVGLELRPPADTSLAVGKSIVLAAADGGKCIGGPASYWTLAYWKATDSTIVSVAALDSFHVRVTGALPGTAAVIASQSPVFASTWTTTQVTVH